jgi:hypothetical protein
MGCVQAIDNELYGGRPRLKALEVTHYRQRHSWDCGLACAVMVLRAFAVNSVAISELYESCQTHSIWTVDLAHTLTRCVQTSTRLMVLLLSA